MFLMWPILAGSVVALVPLVIHLMHRQRTRPLDWAAMQFLLAAPIQQRRRAHVDHWLLMLLRMLVLLVLVMLLARPLIPSWLLGAASGAVGGTPADIAVVIDHSASMGRRTVGGETLFAIAIDRLQELGKMLRPSDSVSIVLAEHTPRVLTSTPVTPAELPRVIQTLRQMDNGLTDGPIPDALGAAREQVRKGSHLKKLIVVLSDAQRTGWQVNGEGAWRAALGDRHAGPDRDIGIYAVHIPVENLPANLSVAQAQVRPALVGIGRPAQLFAAVRNAGPGASAESPVRLIVDGNTVATQRLAALDSGQSQTVRFDYAFPEPGWHWAKIQVDAADALDADNSTLAAVNVWNHLPVLVVDGQLSSVGGFPSSAFLTAAMSPGGGPANSSLIQPTVISAADLDTQDLDKYAVVILNDVPRLSEDMPEKLASYTQSGRGIWIILGRRTDGPYLDDALGRTLLPAMAEMHQHADTQPAPTVAVKDPDNPMVSVITQSERNAFAGVTLTDWWKLSPPSDLSTVVLATSTGDPLVIGQDIGGRGGRIVLWATSVDGQWNNFPLLANSFVPLVNETLYYLAAGQNHSAGHELAAGQPIVWSGPAQPAVESATLTRPQGPAAKLDVTLSNGQYITSYGNTFAPGLYKLNFTPTSVPQPVFFAVGLDPHELDPAVLSAADTEWLTSEHFLTGDTDLHGVATALGAENTGIEIWPLVALLVLLGLVAETLLTWRMIRLQTGQDVRAILAPGEASA